MLPCFFFNLKRCFYFVNDKFAGSVCVGVERANTASCLLVNLSLSCNDNLVKT